MRIIFVSGGVLSGLGKGITTSSIGFLLKSMGFDVTAIKIDPYLNVDAGTMNPYQHGEVFVLDDGSEVDQDLGNYERFLDINLNGNHNITTGKVYFDVIKKERRGDYLGQTVQIIPHVTNEIKKRIIDIAKEHEITLVEIGGTVGDIESMPFLEAVRQIGNEYPNTFYIHVTYVPEIDVVGEQKTKPTQHSVMKLREVGIQPDAIVVRSRRFLEEIPRKKIALYSNLPEKAIFSAPDVDIIYKVPLILESQGLSSYILKKINLKNKKPDLSKLKEFLDKIENSEREVKIGIVGKYTKLKDAYISHNESLTHVSGHLGIKIKKEFIESEILEKVSPQKILNGLDAILIPGGFGNRGIEGKINAIKFARENDIPILGVCLGFQLMVIEYARNVIGLKDANSTEFSKTKNPVIDLLPEQFQIKNLGGSMRLGSKKIILKKGIVYDLYKKKIIYERHRHRYEVNPKFIDKLEDGNLKFTGTDEDGIRMEVLELKENNFFVGTQFHPEFKSRIFNPSKLHLGLIKSSVDFKYFL